MKLEVSEQVYRFAAGLAPQPEQQLRKAIEELARGHGDIRSLEGELAEFYRLRVGR